MSLTNTEETPAAVENSSMSPAEMDVLEMRGLVCEIADLLTPSPYEKDRIAAVRGVFKDSKGRFLVSWNRTLEFLRGRVRLVQNWEMRHAADQLAELRQLEQQRREHEHFNWLDELVASDPKLRRWGGDRLQRLLRRDREDDRTVARSQASR